MGNNFSKALQKFYVRKGNRVVFSNGMTLNQLATEMWERLGYKEIDASVLSRVLKGERMFTKKQLGVFCSILSITVSEEEMLKASIWENLLGRAGFDQNNINDSKESKLIYSLFDDYFDFLLSKPNTIDATNSYKQEIWGRFFEGDFNKLAAELERFRDYIIKHGLDTSLKGRIWLLTISALRANCLSHAFNPEKLTHSPYVVKNDFENWQRYVGDDIPLEIKTMHFATWGTFLRVAAEYLYFLGKTKPEYRQESLRLLQLSVRLRQYALLALGKESKIAMTFHSELCATMADICAFYPKRSNAFEEWEAHHRFALNIASRYHKQNIGWEACTHEFKARWNIFLLTSLKKSGAQTKLQKRLVKECFREIEIADKLIKEANGKADIIDINNNVTKVKLYEYLEEPVPYDIRQKALGLVVSHNDYEQGFRLLKGW